MDTNIFLGIGLHAIGGIAAATCFVPQKGTSRWSYQSFWLLMCLFAWFIVPVVVAAITVPDLMNVIKESPSDAILNTFLLGAVYGFGGMAFGLAIRHIGFSLTYCIAIGISAVLGTVVPAMLKGELIETFTKTGGSYLLVGFIISLVGIAICGLAGSQKEKELAGSDSGFDLKKGLLLVILAGVLSSVFGISLAQGAPIDEVADEHGAGIYKANAKYIFAMGGAFIINLIWWGVVHTRQKTWTEYTAIPAEKKGNGSLATHYVFGMLAGILWYLQFFFYGLGEVNMSEGSLSWGIHMAMLIFFSFGIGLILKEWKGLQSKTVTTLLSGLVILLISFGIITYGLYLGS